MAPRVGTLVGQGVCFDNPGGLDFQKKHYGPGIGLLMEEADLGAGGPGKSCVAGRLGPSRMAPFAVWGHPHNS